MGAMDDIEWQKLVERVEAAARRVEGVAAKWAAEWAAEWAEPAKPLAPTSCTECGDSRIEADVLIETLGSSARGAVKAAVYVEYPCLRCRGCGETFTLCSVLMDIEDAEIAIKDWGAPEYLDDAQSPLAPADGETFSNTAVKNPPKPSADAMRKR